LELWTGEARPLPQTKRKTEGKTAVLVGKREATLGEKIKKEVKRIKEQKKPLCPICAMGGGGRGKTTI